MGKNFRETLNRQLQNPAFQAEWEAQEAEFQLIRALIDARNESELTQKQLSERSGITQADISRIENGNANPSLRTLQRLADGMNMSLKIEFIPKAAAL